MIGPSPSLPAGVSGCSRRTFRDGLARRGAEREGGFTLVEVMICTLVLAIGMLGVASLLAVTTQMHVGAREAARSTRVAQDKIDELMKLDFDDDAEVAVGGSLEENEDDHFEEDPGGQDCITVRWTVAAGPVGDTRVLTVRVRNARARQYGRQVELSTIIRNW